MHVLNSTEYLAQYPARIQGSLYGVFGIFKDKTDGALSIGFGDYHHVTLRREMENGREMIGGGAITVEKDGYKVVGKTSQALDYPELPLEFMQSIADDICRVLQTNSLSFPVRGDVVRIVK